MYQTLRSNRQARGAVKGIRRVGMGTWLYLGQPHARVQDRLTQDRIWGRSTLEVQARRAQARRLAECGKANHHRQDVESSTGGGGTGLGPGRWCACLGPVESETKS